MKIKELKCKTDKDGFLKLEEEIGWTDTKVRIFVLLEEEVEEQEDEKFWLKSLSNNPAFDFLNDPEEDIYSLKDGEPFND